MILNYKKKCFKDNRSKKKLIVKQNYCKFCRTKTKLNEIENFKKFWRENGADEVLIRKLHTNSGDKIDHLKMM